MYINFLNFFQNHDQKWKYPTVNNTNKVATPPNSISYMSSAAAAGMPPLYDMGGQNKGLGHEQQFVYMSNQMHPPPQAGMTLHHPQYLPPQSLAQQSLAQQSLAQQLHQQMRHQQPQVRIE